MGRGVAAVRRLIADGLLVESAAPDHRCGQTMIPTSLDRHRGPNRGQPVWLCIGCSEWEPR